MLSSFFRSFLFLGFVWLLAFSSWAQSVAVPPEYTLSIRADDMPINPEIGIPIQTKTITLMGQLTPQSIQAYPLLEPTVLIKECVINFVRNGRRYSMMLWKGSELPFVGFINTTRPQVGDRCAIEITDARTQTKDGVTRKFPRHKTFQFPLWSL